MAKSIPFAQRDMSNYNVTIQELSNGGRNIIYRPKLTPEEYERRYKEFQQATVDFMISYWNWQAERECKKS